MASDTEIENLLALYSMTRERDVTWPFHWDVFDAEKTWLGNYKFKKTIDWYVTEFSRWSTLKKPGNG